MSNQLKTLILILAATAACSSSNKATDAPKSGSDAKGTDAKVFMDAAKVFMDAPIASTVNIVTCTGASIAQTITTTANDTFMPTTATIAANGIIEFTTTDDHNFENKPGAPANALFRSANPGSQTVCLQFTVAGTFPFQCDVHGGMGMVGTLTVN
jgi:plastocyanin